MAAIAAPRGVSPERKLRRCVSTPAAVRRLRRRPELALRAHRPPAPNRLRLAGLCAAALCAAAGPALAQAPPAGETGDRAASVLERLRRRDADAALKRYAGRWRKADRPADAARPAAPRRLRATPAIPVLRTRQDEAGGEPDPPGGLDLDINLDDLDLGDLELPDDLKLDPDAAPDADDADGDDERDALTPESERPVRAVRDLKGIREILPFGDYDPDPDPDDPCRNLCPRPPGCPAADDADGGEGRTAALCPEVRPLSEDLFSPRPVRPVQYRWAASNIAYNPLYFQDVGLERYGHNLGVFQPVASVGKFGVQLFGLPYQMSLDPPCKCVTPLGYYRPGDCAPKLHYQIPLNARAAATQAAAVAVGAAIIP